MIFWNFKIFSEIFHNFFEFFLFFLNFQILYKPIQTSSQFAVDLSDRLVQSDFQNIAFEYDELF